MNPDLAKVREWAQAELDSLDEPPWATGRYHHLIQTIDRMLGTQPLSPAAAAPRRAKVVHICSARQRSAQRR